LVEQVTNASFQRHTAKVVLSRATRLLCRDPIAPWPLLAAWQENNPNCFQFAFHFSDQRTFIGCSPERLFKRKGRALITEALAGTSLRSDLPEEEQRLTTMLLTDAKIRRENTLVVEDIRQRLATLCDDFEVAPTSILKLMHVQHLKHRIHGYLKESTSDTQLLASLHPTPAVGGTPREQALAFICRHEPYQRGWYAGVCGYLSEQRSEFCVAIRSALIDHRTIQLFAGAGIVNGSDAEQEWQELNTKIHTLMTLLEG
jgi:menaquinone-specific isochorismate synthase